MKIKLFLLITLFVSAQLSASTKGVDVIYGEDNRRDIFETTNPSFLEMARSTAAMISTSKLTLRGEEYTVNGTSLQSRGICAKERFSQQVSAANCSGFLVAENKLVTAGHCIKTEADCAGFKWVFDYNISQATQNKILVPSMNVLSCKRIISRSLDSFSKNDYALIELDRNVTDRQPVKFRRSGKPASGDALVVIGHPSGLPTKIADGANIRNLLGKYFVANLDTYGGNSGSAVFNVQTEEVEGILVRGETDYVLDSALGCQVSNICPQNGCRGEEVTYITNIDALMNL